MKYIESRELPEGEKVYLKKDWFGWRVVSPIKNEDGSWNWFNLIFGSKSNLVFLILLILIGVTIYFGIQELVDNYQLIADNPCDFCYDCQAHTREVIAQISKYSIGEPLSYINMTNLNPT